MRAASFTGEPELSVEDATALKPGSSDVVVHADASGACHSDPSR